MTWFNQAIKLYVDCLVASAVAAVYYGADETDKATDSIDLLLRFTESTPVTMAAGKFYFGTSKTNLVHSKAATVNAATSVELVNEDCSAFLTAGTKYYWQYRPDSGDGCVGADSGIYYFVAE